MADEHDSDCSADIYTAAREGDLERLRYLVLVQAVAINEPDVWDAMPLYYASRCGHTACVRFLLQHGARCEEHTWEGERCHYAALNFGIRNILREFQAVNRLKGPHFAW